MIRIIKNEQRHHFQSDWLSTYWHFSFDHYYDPANMGFGALRVFNDDWILPASGFPMHSHREMEIITYVLEGELEHKDSTGGSGRIRGGEVQRMSAGTGIRHSEYNPSADTKVHLLQMWITPAVSALEPSYEQKQFTVEERAGKLLAVASGQKMPGALKIHQDATLYVSSLQPGDDLGFDLGAARKAYLFVIDGELRLNGQDLGAGDQARVEAEPGLRLIASKPSEIALIDLG
jgi:redox-sensitive bicupin YhaK (pirin superfamily)